ncbi:hypothetical protein SDC9_180543 [bioreactor metagenome]|uniref:Uncharacterized protein n=1 Tax=bioreactor metagenome TaxID=1076179 RepID=A0A645H2Z8_9ZZZZ
MTYGTANQRLCGIKAGLHAVMERWVRDDHIKAPRHFREDVAGKDFALNAIRRQGGATGFHRRRGDVTER